MRAYHLLHALWVALAIAAPVKRETFETYDFYIKHSVLQVISVTFEHANGSCSYSVKARDLQNSIDTTLHTRQSPHSGAPSSASAQKNSKRADIPSTVRNIWRNIKVGGRDISRRSPLTFDQLAGEVEKDLVVTSIDKLFWSLVPNPKPHGSSKPEPAPTGTPTADDPQAVAPGGGDAVSLASEPSDVFRYTPEAGSSLSSICSGYNCFANVR